MASIKYPLLVKSSTDASPSRLLSFLWASFIICDRWMYFGISHPKAWYNRLYFGAEDRYSLPLTTGFIFIRWSSTTLAKRSEERRVGKECRSRRSAYH